MDAEARGIYITLLCNCWIENSIPNNPDIIEPLLNRGSTDVEHKANQWEKIRRCFYEKKGRLFHKRLEAERDKQKKFKKSQSDKGKLSGIARQKTSEPRFNRGSTDVQPDANSSIFGFQSSNEEKKIQTRQCVDWEKILEEWNIFAKEASLSLINEINEKRKARVRLLMKKPDFSFSSLFKMIRKQPFLIGDSDKGWKTNFDWVINPSNYLKIMEGQYIRKTGSTEDMTPEEFNKYQEES